MVNRSVRFDAKQSDVSEQSAMSDERTLRHLKIVSTFNFSDPECPEEQIVQTIHCRRTLGSTASEQ